MSNVIYLKDVIEQRLRKDCLKFINTVGSKPLTEEEPEVILEQEEKIKYN